MDLYSEMRQLIIEMKADLEKLKTQISNVIVKYPEQSQEVSEILFEVTKRYSTRIAKVEEIQKSYTRIQQTNQRNE